MHAGRERPSADSSCSSPKPKQPWQLKAPPSSPPSVTPKEPIHSPSAKLHSSLQEIPNLEASVPQPPVRSSSGPHWSHLTTVWQAGRGGWGPESAARLPALVRETRLPRAQTLEKLDPNSPACASSTAPGVQRNRAEVHGAEWRGQPGEEGGVEGKGQREKRRPSSQSRNFSQPCMGETEKRRRRRRARGEGLT